MTNREIKFRAWDGKVMHVDLYEVEWLTDGSYNINEDVRIAQNGLMQYTGLKDKNGREIYEGDVVEAYERKCTVLYADIRAMYIAHDTWNEALVNVANACTVVGNIHENPELIPA